MLKKLSAILITLTIVTFGLAADSSEFPEIAGKVIATKNFFVNLKGYDTYRLFDVFPMKQGKLMGLSLFDPSDILYQIVFDTRTREVIYTKAEIPSKENRERMTAESITIPDAKKLARFAAEQEKIMRKKQTSSAFPSLDPKAQKR